MPPSREHGFTGSLFTSYLLRSSRAILYRDMYWLSEMNMVPFLDAVLLYRQCEGQLLGALPPNSEEWDEAVQSFEWRGRCKSDLI